MPIFDNEEVLDDDEDEEEESDEEEALTNPSDELGRHFNRFIRGTNEIENLVASYSNSIPPFTAIDDNTTLGDGAILSAIDHLRAATVRADEPIDNDGWVHALNTDGRSLDRFNVNPRQAVIYDINTGEIVRYRNIDFGTNLFSRVQEAVLQIVRNRSGSGGSAGTRRFRVQSSTGRLNDPTPLEEIPAGLLEDRETAEFDRRQDMGHERDVEMFNRIREGQRMKFIDRINEINNYLAPKDQITQMCNLCFRGINERIKESFVTADEMIVCERCYRNRFRSCVECGNETHSIDMVTRIDGERICMKCAQQKYGECPGCDLFDLVADFRTYEGQKICQLCIESINHENNPMPSSANSGSIATRNYTSRKSAKFCSSDEGSIIKSKRMFSAEIECMYPSVQIANALLDEQPRGLGVTYDGSISTHGVELQTPKLQGSIGEKFLKQLCDKLSDAKFDTDKTCGLHIHLDGREFVPHRGGPTSRFDGDALRNLFMFYMVFEDVIMSFLPRSRRSNRYCKQLKREYHLAEIMNSRNLEELEMIWYRVDTPYEKDNCKSHGKHDTRYSGVNFHTLLSESHIEIRYHSGTTRAIKVLEWVNLHCVILDRIYDQSITRGHIIDAQEETDMDLKTELFFQLLNLPVRARRYFVSRQNKFKTKERVEEKELISA